MPDAPSTFSESWYRVANQRVALRPWVRVRRQKFRGETWFVLENPFTNDFFRMGAVAYDFIARLDSRRTVEDAWKECLERMPDRAPGQGAVIQLLSQLYHANLLQYDGSSDAAVLFERARKRHAQELRARLLNIMFMRIPLIDPDRFLVRTLPVMGKFIGVFGALLWMAVVGTALKVAVDHWDALRLQSQGILAPQNLPWLYLGMVISKTVHEFGHAYFCRKFGGEVHVMGVMLMIFTPVPYVDATSSWSFRSRWKRLLVGAAGMIIEIFLAALMVFVWANVGQGILHSLAYNMIFVASVSTLIFNANPLLRFDGYYMLSDLLEIPNLSQRASKHLRHLAEKGLFGLKKSESPARSASEKWWLPVFGVSSGIYRIIVFGGILLVVADQFFLIGVLMAAVCFLSWVSVPLCKFIHYLFTDSRLERQRVRAVLVSVALLALILGVLWSVRFPSYFRAQGVVQAREWSQVVNETAGRVVELLASPGSRVSPGQALLRLQSVELDLELEQARAVQHEAQTHLRSALAGRAADLKPFESRVQSAVLRIQKLLADQESLVIRARHDGLWVAPELKDAKNRWISRGTPLGLIINDSAFQFTATVPQEEAGTLFARTLLGAEVRLHGQAGLVLGAHHWQVIPGAQRVLPSPALGWHGGGDMPTAAEDPHGVKSIEPFFEVRTELTPAEGVAFLHGRSGRIRFAQEWEPLLPRWIRELRQLMQRRYQL